MRGLRFLVKTTRISSERTRPVMTSTMPPPLPTRANRPHSKSVSDITEFESRFRFHADLPHPEPYIGGKKNYPSSLVTEQPKENPPPPPPPRRQRRPSLPPL